MKIIVGLGNPGKEYENTRHNIGFMALDFYLKDVKWQKGNNALYHIINHHGEKVLFIKPTTYMNLSGDAVSYYLNYYKIDNNSLLVIQDDIDLDLGKIRIKKNSSSGGHNGIKDIIQKLKTEDFLRVKIGISKTSNINIKDYVLSKFSNDEIEILNKSFETASKIIDDFLDQKTPNELMENYN